MKSDEKEIRIAINASSLMRPMTGIGNYTYHICKGAYEKPSVHTSFFYEFYWSSNRREFIQSPQADRWFARARNYIPYARQIRNVIQKRRFETGLKAKKLDLYHEPNIIPFETDIPTVTTIHDLSWLHYPDFHPKDRVKLLNEGFQKGLRISQHIICDSEYVRQELIRDFSIAPESVSAIHLGAKEVDLSSKTSDFEPLARILCIQPQSYFLSIGTIEPRKNFISALQAYDQLPLRIKKTHPLVHIGGVGWMDSLLREKQQKLMDKNHVIALGYVGEDEKLNLLANACALIFPSIYEGFGLPPVEAMKLGTPTIASNTSSMPEIIGNAGILVDPFDVDALSEKMTLISENRELRMEISKNALARSKQFSWDNCFNNTLNVYQQVAL